MGMFDYVRCEYPLPDYPLNAPQEEIHFQTKDTDEQYLKTYVISAEGQLILEDVLQDYTGGICFYDSNVVAIGPGTYTRDGEDSHWLEYISTFVHGKLTHIERSHYSFEPAQKSSQMWRDQPKFANEKERMDWWNAQRKEFEDWQAAELKRRAEAKA